MKKTIDARLRRIAAKQGIKLDAWHTDLPDVKQIEELDALSTPLHRCNCCGYMTLSSREENERCGVCAWVDTRENEIAHELNESITLRVAKENFREFGACSKGYFGRTRSPRFREMCEDDEQDESIQESVVITPESIKEVQEYRDNISMNKDKVPLDLHGVIPLAQKWGIGDDAVRGDATSIATDDDKREMIALLKGKIKVIERWLEDCAGDSMSDEAEAFMYLMEAVEELDVEIEKLL